MLKSLPLLCCLTLVSLGVAVANPEKPFTLKGKVKGATPEYVYLSYGRGATYALDSARVKKGSFQFRKTLSQPTAASLFIDRAATRNWGAGSIAQVFIEPGKMSIVLEEGKLSEARLSGSQTDAEFGELLLRQAGERAALRPLNVKYDSLNEEYIKARNAKDSVKAETLKEQLESIRAQFGPISARMSEMEQEFMRSHPNSVVSAYLLLPRVNSMPLEKGMAIYESFSEEVKQSSYGLQAFEELRQLKAGSPGAVAHVFTKKDINGETLSLADYRGKYVLLDFWASWCVPCRKGNPHLLKVYQQYKNRGFEIIGISDDDSNHEAWRKAVEKDGIGVWKHVLRGLDMQKRMKGEANPDDLSDYYGISTLPTKILINPHGIIIGRWGTEEAELDAKLAEVLPPKKEMKLTAHIRGLTDSVVSLNFFEGNERRNVSIPVHNEKFEWTGTIKGQQKAMLGTSRRYMELFVENGDIHIDGDIENLYYSKVTGSNAQDEYDRYNASMNEIDSLLMVQYRALHQSKDSKERLAIEEKIQGIRGRMAAAQKKYIGENPGSPVSLSLVQDKAVMGEYGDVNELYQLLNAEAKATDAGKRLAERLEVLRRSAIGASVKDFTIPSIKGKPVRISDFKGKYLFIDFWASWCGPCRAENPNVLRAYNKFKNKNFTVLGISLDDNGDKWKEAVIKDKMPWTQVSDLKGFDAEVARYYGIMGIPTTYLVDPEGNIIAKNLRGEQLHKKLEEILQ